MNIVIAGKHSWQARGFFSFVRRARWPQTGATALSLIFNKPKPRQTALTQPTRAGLNMRLSAEPSLAARVMAACATCVCVCRLCCCVATLRPLDIQSGYSNFRVDEPKKGRFGCDAKRGSHYISIGIHNSSTLLVTIS